MVSTLDRAQDAGVSGLKVLRKRYTQECMPQACTSWLRCRGRIDEVQASLEQAAKPTRQGWSLSGAPADSRNA
jgi:hypothetical protein